METSTLIMGRLRAVAFLIGLSLWGAALRAADEFVYFGRDVRPILSNSCFACHGPDEKARKAKLRLDVRAVATREAIVPGAPERSELIARVTAADPDDRMPPPDSSRPALTEAEIDLLRRWIVEGASFEEHWAYRVPERPAPPSVEDPDWARNPLDRFLQAGFETRGVPPAPEADRRTLIRRLSFDLLGLPPTPAATAAFVADASPSAYEELVERLLASPHFGERMAAYWLDVVRYADTVGIHGDQENSMSPYRDYVIDAFNENLPYDRFLTEQLAGDLLPDATLRQKVASAFNRLHMITAEGGAQNKEYLAKYAADRVRNTAEALFGTTFGCAECHDHKYDPFTTRDFYQFAAFFADLKETGVYGGSNWFPKMPVPTAAERARLKQLERELRAARDLLATPTPALEEARARWETEILDAENAWRQVVAEELHSEEGTLLTAGQDGVITATGSRPETDVYTIIFEARRDVRALRLEVLPDEALPAKGPGRAPNGNFVLSHLEVLVDGEQLEWTHATASHQQNDYPVTAAKNADPKKGWAILPQTGRQNQAVFQLPPRSDPEKTSTWTVRLHQKWGGQHTLGRFRLATTSSAAATVASALPGAVRRALERPPKERNDDEERAIGEHFRTITPLLDGVRERIKRIEKSIAATRDAMATVLVSEAVEPRVMRILPRGNWLDESGEVVEPAPPAFLSFGGAGRERATRLDLARWMVDARNPLVARVQVNRLWKIAFGRGIVATMDDFGSQGRPPSQPELLDWLAVELRESGWDLKHVLRLIVTSSAYRQSSLAGTELRRRDPENGWFARQGRFRLDAEMVRDNALAVSGLLVPRLGGRSTHPYQPPGYYAHLNFPRRTYTPDPGANQYRRGLYTHWQRTFLHPMFKAFDAPTREECTAERPRSNTPLQSLVLLNDPTFVEAARALAERVTRECGPDTDRGIVLLYRAVLVREPTGEEIRTLRALFEKHRARFENDQEAARSLLAVGNLPVDGDLEPATAAAWASVARVILNLHETITRN